MKKFICALLLVALLFSIAVSAYTTPTPTLENLDAPLESYLKEYTDETVGKNIWDMTYYNGNLYIGWGDYGDNLGAKLGGMPLLRYHDLTNSWRLATILDDEEIARFFQYDDKLYIPGTDPIKRVGSIYVGDDKGVWNILSTYDGGIHVFDMLVQDDVMYIGYGHGGEKAIIRYTTNQITFNEIEFRYDGEPVMAGRCYNIFELDGDVYATLTVHSDKYDGVYKLDKTNMVLNFVGKGIKGLAKSGSNIFDCEFQGNYVYANKTLNYTKTPGDENNWTTADAVKGTVTCAKVIDGSLYVTAYTEAGNKYKNTIYKTDDLKNFEALYSFEYDAFVRSFCYGNGNFYMGTGCTSAKPTTKAGTVFSLSAEKNEKTDIVVKVDVGGKEGMDYSWVRFQLKAGDTIIADEMLNKVNGWEYSINGADKRDDWSIEIISNSFENDWKIENKDGIFLLKNTEGGSSLLIILVAVGGIVIIGAVVLLVVILRKKKAPIKTETE